MTKNADPYLTTKTAYFYPEYGREVAKYLNDHPYPQKLRNRKKSHYKIPKKFAYKQLKGETNTNRSTNK
jgi:hypothetical protein